MSKFNSFILEIGKSLYNALGGKASITDAELIATTKHALFVALVFCCVIMCLAVMLEDLRAREKE